MLHLVQTEASRAAIPPPAIGLADSKIFGRKNRLCELCDLEVETEAHSLLYCTKHDDLRVKKKKHSTKCARQKPDIVYR